MPQQKIVNVRGYTTKKGVYVKPHSRTIQSNTPTKSDPNQQQNNLMKALFGNPFTNVDKVDVAYAEGRMNPEEGFLGNI